MTCDNAEPLLGAYHDGELTDIVHLLELEGHLKDCPNCARQLDALGNLGRNLREKAIDHRAPAHLRKNIASAIRAETRQTPLWAWRRSAFAAGAGAVFATVLALFILLPRTDDRLGAELVEGHIRSLQADHLFDVASSSRHTVKPWFQGKVDFSPAVPDLVGAGFPLVGGRLDYIGGRPCVALVYKRFKHVINVFAARSPANGSIHDSEGFHILHWRIRELDYWAVSDLNSAELREFSEMFVSAAKE